MNVGQCLLTEDESACVTRRAMLRLGVTGASALGLTLGLEACGGAATGSSSSSSRAPQGFIAPPTGAGKPVAQLTWGIIGDPVSMDYTHAYDNESLTVVPSMTEPLFLYDSHSMLQPNLATSYRYENPQTVILTLRADVPFQDGATMTAEDVAFSMQRHMDPSVGSLLGFYYGRVASIAPTGPLEVTVRLHEPDSQFVPALSTAAGMIASKAYIEKTGKAFGTASGGTLGTGPYRFVSWEPGQQVVLERFDGYWNKQRAHQVKRFVASILKDESTIVSAIVAGDLDGTIPGLSGHGLRALASSGTGLAFNRAAFLGGYFLALNCQARPFDDARVRKALSYALDPATLAAATYGSLGQTIKTLAPPPMWSFDRAQWSEAYAALPNGTDNMTKAKALINQALPNGASGVLMYASDRVPDVILAPAIQQAAAGIGIKLSVTPVTEAELASAIGEHPRPYSILMNFDEADIPDPANNYATTFTSTASNNVMGYKNPRVDGYLNAQRAITDQNKRTADLLAAQSLIVADCPIVPTFAPELVMVQTPKIGGFTMLPTWYWYPWIGDLSGA